MRDQRGRREILCHREGRGFALKRVGAWGKEGVDFKVFSGYIRLTRVLD